MNGAANRVEVLHGVNLNTLGSRDPAIYGSFTLAELEIQIEGWAKDLGLITSFMQTNMEGEFIEHLHRVGERADAVILNPGSWTHYSWAIRDALEVAGILAVEVHISDIHSREEWRHHSVLEGLVLTQVSGKGPDGYKEALELIAAELGKGQGDGGKGQGDGGNDKDDGDGGAADA